jgi:hypothetical protein
MVFKACALLVVFTAGTRAAYALHFANSAKTDGPADPIRAAIGTDMDIANFQSFVRSDGQWDVDLFNKYCHPGDYCLKIKYPVVEVESKQDCPLLDTQERQDWACLYRPHGSPMSSQQFSHNTVSEYLSSMSGEGKWNCETNSWHLLGGESIPVFDAANVPTNVDNIITYGDSTAQQTYMGLTMVANNFTPGQWWHSRDSVSSADIEQFQLEQICCASCACGLTVDKAVDKLKKAVQKGKQTLVIFRPSLHTNQNAEMMVNELAAAMQSLEELQQPYTALWIPSHGSGIRKGDKYLTQGQTTTMLRKYDTDILAGLKARNFELAEKLHKLDLFEMFQAAENQCEGAYGSPDGTHFSFNLMAHAGHAVLGLAQKL